jgi:glycosyltransferase involved in cell wall biosynthesis
MVRELRLLGHPVDLMLKEDFGLRAEFSQMLTPFVMQFLIAFKMAKRRFRLDYDVVHVHAGDGCVWGLTRRLIGCHRPAFVWTTHDLESVTLDVYDRYQHLELVPKFSPMLLWGYRCLGWRSGISARLSDCTVAITTANACWLRNHFHLSNTQLAVIPNGVNPELLNLPRPSREQIRKVLFIGTWWWRKGHWLVRDAFIELAQAYPDLQLHLWGTATTASTVVSQFPEPFRCRVHVRPQFEQTELQAQLPEFDMFLLPSVYEGGTPLALLEAMAAGLPCVVGQAPGVEDLVGIPPVMEVAEAGNARSVVAACRRLVENPGAAKTLGLRAREHARRFVWSEAAKKVSAVYCRLSPAQPNP